MFHWTGSMERRAWFDSWFSPTGRWVPWNQVLELSWVWGMESSTALPTSKKCIHGSQSDCQHGLSQFMVCLVLIYLDQSIDLHFKSIQDHPVRKISVFCWKAPKGGSRPSSSHWTKRQHLRSTAAASFPCGLANHGETWINVATQCHPNHPQQGRELLGLLRPGWCKNI